MPRRTLCRLSDRTVPALAALLLAVGLASPAETADAPQFTALQIIEALAPPPAEPATRGINVRPGQQTAQAPRALSMRVQFEYNSAVLTPAARRDLDQLGIALTSDRLREMRFGLDGHADAAGTDEYNLDLSTRRANAVKDYLARQFRVATDRLQAVGKGERELADPAHPLSEINRRVVITNLGG